MLLGRIGVVGVFNGTQRSGWRYNLDVPIDWRIDFVVT